MHQGIITCINSSIHGAAVWQGHPQVPIAAVTALDSLPGQGQRQLSPRAGIQAAGALPSFARYVSMALVVNVHVRSSSIDAGTGLGQLAFD
jgi:hypothetical protein